MGQCTSDPSNSVPLGPTLLKQRGSLSSPKLIGSVQEYDRRHSDAEEVRNVQLTLEQRRDVLDATRAMDSFRGEQAFSIGSCTDRELSGQEPFSKKAVVKTADVDEAAIGFGYACHKGTDSELPNQDSWFVLQVNERYRLYGVFDGHGKRGHEVSHFVRAQLPNVIVQDERFGGVEMKQLLKDAFKKVQAMVAMATDMCVLDARRSGTTTSIVVHDRELGRLWVAHVGNSSLCVVRRCASGRIRAFPLTRAQEPALDQERARIEQAGGHVAFVDDCFCRRVSVVQSGGISLATARSLGDLEMHNNAGVSAEPEISEYVLENEDDALLLCTDGVWTFGSYSDAAFLAMRYDKTQAMDAAKSLAKAARDIGRQESDAIDDITALCIYLNSEVISPSGCVVS